jgi:hypothetical protein
VTLGHVGLLTGVVATSGLLLARSSLLPLMVFGMLTGLMESLSISGVRWPLLQNIMPPELRGTGRAVVDMLVGIVTAGALVLSSTLVEALGQNVALMMLILVPLPKVLASLAWIPMYRTYARDVDAMHAGLREQRQRIVEA